MSAAPILLFLHGVGDGDKNDRWKDRASKSLTRLGYPDLDAVRVIAPKYANALKVWDEKEALPGVTVKQPAREAARRNRREFERRTAAIEFRLGRHEAGSTPFGVEAAMNAGIPLVTQAHRYLTSAQIRAQVLNRILSKLPETGRLVIVGHSLGSVIAADLVRRLPVGLEVVGMITIGSPLANGGFNVDKLRETLSEPPPNLSWWVNFWNQSDPVSTYRGLSSVFPWILDFRIRTKAAGVAAHYAVDYLADDAVAAALGFALFGSRSKELAVRETGIDIPLDFAETIAILALRYAHLIKMRLEGDHKDRYSGALRQVQATAIESIRKRNSEAGRALPSLVARLAFDLSDPHAGVPEPLAIRNLTKEDSIVPLTVLASENIIRPFEIAVPKDKLQSAMEDLTAEMGFGSPFGAGVFNAAKRAQEALSPGRSVNWIKWAALGLGAAALAVASGGLVLAAGAGLAGAAAITSALAAFGPGGMIGGLLTAGTLVTAGGGSIAYGLASPSTSAETLEAVVVRQLAAEILRRDNAIDPDSAIWGALIETEVRVRRDHERLDEFSDDSAPALKELKRKIDSIERALKYMEANGLAPTASKESDEEAA